MKPTDKVTYHEINIWKQDERQRLKKELLKEVKSVRDMDDKGEFEGLTRGEDGELMGAVYNSVQEALDEIERRINKVFSEGK